MGPLNEWLFTLLFAKSGGEFDGSWMPVELTIPNCAQSVW
jgi:hypothetical protein